MTSPIRTDLLTRATRALRDEAAQERLDTVEAWEGMHGWHDVSRDVRKAARRRRVAVVVGIQLLALVVGVGAWAAASGRLPDLFSRRPQPSERRASSAGAHGRHGRPRLPVAPLAAPPPPVEPAAPIVPLPSPPPAAATAGPALPDGPPSPSAAPRSSAPRSVSVTGPPRPTLALVARERATETTGAVEPDELYRQAHREHFVHRDYAAALALWDRYLAGGGGSLTLEARYNRAIALVRLRRRDEALAALAAFAAGEHDGYRQQEAQALLRMLRATGPPSPSSPR